MTEAQAASVIALLTEIELGVRVLAGVVTFYATGYGTFLLLNFLERLGVITRSRPRRIA